jgi:hypothetical protein
MLGRAVVPSSFIAATAVARRTGRLRIVTSYGSGRLPCTAPCTTAGWTSNESTACWRT